LRVLPTTKTHKTHKTQTINHKTISYLVSLVIESNITAVIGVRTEASFVLNLSRAVPNVKGDFFVLGPDLVAVAPSPRVTTRVVLETSEAFKLKEDTFFVSEYTFVTILEEGK